MRESYAWGAEYCFSVTGECGSVDVFRDSAGHNGGRCRNPAWREEVEPGTAMLMADNGFLNFCEEELTACLQPQIAGRPDAQERVEGAARRHEGTGRKGGETRRNTHGSGGGPAGYGGKGWSRE